MAKLLKLFNGLMIAILAASLLAGAALADPDCTNPAVAANNKHCQQPVVVVTEETEETEVKTLPAQASDQAFESTGAVQETSDVSGGVAHLVVVAATDDDASENANVETAATVTPENTLVDGPGNTYWVCQLTPAGWNNHPISQNNWFKFIENHEGSYMGTNCGETGGGNETPDDPDNPEVPSDACPAGQIDHNGDLAGCGEDTEIPTDDGNPTRGRHDVCKNVPGMQGRVLNGYYRAKDGKNCYPYVVNPEEPEARFLNGEYIHIIEECGYGRVISFDGVNFVDTGEMIWIDETMNVYLPWGDTILTLILDRPSNCTGSGSEIIPVVISCNGLDCLPCWLEQILDYLVVILLVFVLLVALFAVMFVRILLAILYWIGRMTLATIKTVGWTIALIIFAMILVTPWLVIGFVMMVIFA